MEREIIKVIIKHLEDKIYGLREQYDYDEAERVEDLLKLLK